MLKPTFSIIIPALNEEKFLPRLLESLILQSDKDFEVIVVDGNSKDKTVEVARTFAKKLPGFKLVTCPKASLPYQRNMGARQAHGDWLVFVDADGEFLPQFIERSKVYIQTHEVNLFTTWWRADTDENKDAQVALLANLTIELTLVFHRPHAPGPLTIVSRAAYDTVDGYDEDYAFTEDLDFGLRLGKAGYTLAILRETLYVWSLRRIRKEGTFKVVQSYAKAAALALVAQRAPKAMPGYIMGGQLYDKKKKSGKRPIFGQYEQKLKKLMNELFD
jgi:glycosyltransferase involved in cell wall biosynthesis